jgi:SAM-dependent methyltransferase
MSMANSMQASYARESAMYENYAPGKPLAPLGETWSQDAAESLTVDAWRHRRMYANLDPILEDFSQARWLTVGDGRYGRDAQYLQRHGAQVVATDISAVLLEEAKRRNLLTEVRAENAEKLTFSDESFDWALCKESYHHFPRPMMALYEMLRVTRQGIALIEPFDRFYHSPFPEAAWNWIKALPRRLSGRYQTNKPFRFEPTGNFIYVISPREMEKVAMALDLPCLAFRFQNDHYVQGVETELAEEGNATFEAVQREIARLDVLCRLRIRQPQILTTLIFKQMPSEALLTDLRQQGFQISMLPRNPYRKS